MKRIRVIPLLMIDSGRAVVTQKFRKRIYVGDPINAIKILNDKEVDELIILDITDKRKQHKPDFDLIAKMASESFMPLTYGGHVKTIKDAETIIKSGVEKISFNTAVFEHPEVIRELSFRYGTQSIVASIDVRKNWLGKFVVKTHNNSRKVGYPTQLLFNKIIQLGVGEILVNSIDRDGGLKGYDLQLIKRISSMVAVPVIACGGAASIQDFAEAIQHGASAVAAGAMFYFKGSFNAILINYPDQKILTNELYTLL